MKRGEVVRLFSSRHGAVKALQVPHHEQAVVFFGQAQEVVGLGHGWR